MAASVTLDTNILLYAIDASEGAKHTLAASLVPRLARSRPPLMLQCLHEFAAICCKKKLASADEIARVVEIHGRAFQVIPAIPEDLQRALAVREKHKLSFWDALLWAAVRRSGATVLLSEDLQHGRELEGVRFLDPFQLGKRQLNDLLL